MSATDRCPSTALTVTLCLAFCAPVPAGADLPRPTGSAGPAPSAAPSPGQVPAGMPGWMSWEELRHYLASYGVPMPPAPAPGGQSAGQPAAPAPATAEPAQREADAEALQGYLDTIGQMTPEQQTACFGLAKLLSAAAVRSVKPDRTPLPVPQGPAGPWPMPRPYWGAPIDWR